MLDKWPGLEFTDNPNHNWGMQTTMRCPECGDSRLMTKVVDAFDRNAKFVLSLMAVLSALFPIAIIGIIVVLSIGDVSDCLSR